MLEDYLEKVLEQTNDHIDRSMDTSIEVDMIETKQDEDDVGGGDV